MKICFIVTGLGLGGAETQVCNLADELCQKGHVVSIISITGDVVVKPESSLVDIVSLNISKGYSAFCSSILLLIETIRKLEPDIIHSHMYHANILARVACRILNKHKHLICTAHSKNEGGALRMFLYRVTNSFCKITTNVSYEALETFISRKAFKEEMSLCVHNGGFVE